MLSKRLSLVRKARADLVLVVGEALVWVWHLLEQLRKLREQESKRAREQESKRAGEQENRRKGE
jgi:hypothetical protein